MSVTIIPFKTKLFTKQICKILSKLTVNRSQKLELVIE